MRTIRFYRTHLIGKSFDKFCPCGPALVTADEIEWGQPLKMRTEAGVAFFMKPPGFLVPGDVVRCEIERVGAIENRMVAESR